MTQADSYTRVAKIVSDALEAKDSDRTAVIERLCAGDDALRSRLLELLAAGVLFSTRFALGERQQRRLADAREVLAREHTMA